ncbi:hypothetical protein MWU65_08620 [Cellulophaga sp. F20128]|uniref:hypothetical protein n=1 Tax=Cellulophaga sp. F20128 TaxID=2926413 RepID=UPI001FF44AB0|nr:hypothetical protein [Cellulophaga sp. F20128]MCK0157236.1 hypothetical protein [Cellulophaga sp. F20128]
MFRPIAYLKFLVIATNHHGVHSPFIYNYITKCLYTKERLSTGKSENALLKTIDYFNVSAVDIKYPDLTIRLEKTHPHLSYTNEIADFVYFPGPSLTKLKAIKYHNNTVVFIDNIHNTRQTEIQWEAIKNLDTIRVTVDLFYFAIVFFRKEQAKEHFTIRI